MHLLTRNVNTAFRKMVEVFMDARRPPEMITSVVRRPSRNGDVLMIDEPVTVTYTHPRERVLFNAARDANPFFHLYEALWMLAGRNDVAPLAYYARQMSEYSDDGKTLNGAYGYRWRKKTTIRPEDWDHEGTPYNYPKDWGQVDQIDLLVNHLKADPTSRRAVLQMWNVEDDLLKIGLKTTTPLRDDNNPNYRGTMESITDASKDVCCNLSVMFSLRQIETECETTVGCGSGTHVPYYALDMTVTNRSNDLVWGMLGANFVHFTFLQEYTASRLGVEVGRYHHFTNNLHVYSWNWKPDEWLRAAGGKDSIWYWGPMSPGTDYDTKPVHPNGWSPVPLVHDPATFDRELPGFVACFDGTQNDPLQLIDRAHGFSEPFLRDVAGRLLTAHALHRAGDDHGAFAVLADCPADDWRLAAEGWLRRRMK